MCQVLTGCRRTRVLTARHGTIAIDESTVLESNVQCAAHVVLRQSNFHPDINGTIPL